MQSSKAAVQARNNDLLWRQSSLDKVPVSNRPARRLLTFQRGSGGTLKDCASGHADVGKLYP